MSAKSMAEVLAEHPEPEVENGYWYCMCGHDYGVLFDTGTINAHQAAAITAAGFGLVADAKAEALEAAAASIDSGGKISQWLRARAAKLREPVKPTPEGR